MKKFVPGHVRTHGLWPMFLLALLLLGVGFGCDRQKSAPSSPPPEKELPASFYTRFVEVRRTPPIDVAALSALYSKELRTYVQITDKLLGIDQDASITGALDRAAQGDSPRVNGQVAEKTIQRAFVLSLRRGVVDLLANPADPKGLQTILDVVPVIASTADRRSQWVGKGSEYTNAWKGMIQSLQGAFDRKEPERLKIACRRIDAFVTKIFVLSVFYELVGLENARGADEIKAAEKRVEATIFHKNILEQHRRRDSQGAEVVAGQLTQPISQIDIELLRKILQRGFESEIADIDPSILGFRP